MNEQKLNVKLVGEVEKRPVLYNFKLPGYSRKDETEKAWSEVGKVVNMSVAECKERWKNLRAVFVRNMKLSKCGAGAKTKKAYYLLEAMQFAVPYIKALGTPSGNVPNAPEREVCIKSEEIDLNATGQYSEAFLEYVQAKKARVANSSDHDQKSEALKMFLLSMLPDLLKISDEEVRLFKRQSIQIVDDILSNRSQFTPQRAFLPSSTTPSTYSEKNLE